MTFVTRDLVREPPSRLNFATWQSQGLPPTSSSDRAEMHQHAARISDSLAFTRKRTFPNVFNTPCHEVGSSKLRTRLVGTDALNSVSTDIHERGP